MNLIVRPPQLFRRIYPGALWRIDPDSKTIYLTFDDGPVPGVTTEALSYLKKAGVKATFFCVGNNVLAHKDLYQQILDEGHAVGNHTMNHVDGWKTTWRDYMRDIKECSVQVNSSLFRPPYGHMKRSHFNTLSRRCKVVMWDVLTCDFDRTFAPDLCLDISLRYSRPGSIVVFHDSEKAKERMLYTLPRYIEAMQESGYSFGIID